MAPSKTRVCAVTGANGYLGSRLASYLSKMGWTIFELSRVQQSDSKIKHIYFSLGHPLSPEALRDRGVDCVLHCAYDFREITEPRIREVNLEGTKSLLDSTVRAGAKFVLLSTASAFAESRSIYGRVKWDIERLVLSRGGTVLRPGLVYGEHPGGMVGALVGLIRKFPILPLVGGGEKLYPVHEEDLCRAIEMICRYEAPLPEPVLLAQEKALLFQTIIEVFAKRIGKKVLFFPLPANLVLFLLRLLESLGMRLRTRSDSLVSLLNQNPNPDFGPTRRLGLVFRELE